MAALIDAIEVKRKMFFEFENAPFRCLDVEISTPTARGGQTLVRLKMRNLLTRAVFDKTFKASDKFKEPDLETIEATYLYSDADGSYFLDQSSFETLSLNRDMVGDALEFLLEGPSSRSTSTTAIPLDWSCPSRWNSPSLTPNPRSAATPPPAPSPNWPGWRQASSFAFPPSSRKAKRSGSTRRLASSPAAPDTGR